MGIVLPQLAMGVGSSGARMPLIDVQVQYEPAARSLREAGAMLPYVAARVLTAFARDATTSVQAEMPRAFDRPTPFTVRRVNWAAATKATLRSVVGIPQSSVASGRATSEYVRPGALGANARHQKKSEFLLARKGILPAGWVMTPGSWMLKGGKLDAFGNVPGSYYKQVIRSLQIRQAGDRYMKSVSDASRKRATRMGVESEFFAVGRGRNSLAKGGGWLPPGIYKRAGRGGRELQQFFKFMPRAAYKQRLDLPAVAEKTVRTQAQRHWAAAMGEVAQRFAARGGRR